MRRKRERSLKGQGGDGRKAKSEKAVQFRTGSSRLTPAALLGYCRERGNLIFETWGGPASQR